MSSEQAAAMLTLLERIAFTSQALAVVGCFIFAAQLFRLVLQAKNSKNVM